MRHAISLAAFSFLGACAAEPVVEPPPIVVASPPIADAPRHHLPPTTSDKIDLKRQLDEIDAKVKALKDTLDHH